MAGSCWKVAESGWEVAENGTRGTKNGTRGTRNSTRGTRNCTRGTKRDRNRCQNRAHSARKGWPMFLRKQCFRGNFIYGSLYEISPKPLFPGIPHFPESRPGPAKIPEMLALWCHSRQKFIPLRPQYSLHGLRTPTHPAALGYPGPPRRRGKLLKSGWKVAESG